MDTDSAGFADFYRAARDDCLRAVFASVGDRQAAEDLVAEAFARARADWRKVRRHPAPRAWIVRTALNTRVSWWRRAWREVPLPEQEADATGDGSFDGVVDTELITALLRLPVRQRQVAHGLHATRKYTRQEDILLATKVYFKMGDGPGDSLPVAAAMRGPRVSAGRAAPSRSPCRPVA